MQNFFISHTIGPTDLLHLSKAPDLKICWIFLIHFPKRLMFQHHTKLCSMFSNLPVYSLKLSPICWCKEPSSSCRTLLLPRQSCISFSCTFCTICYHATQIVGNIPRSAAVYDLAQSALGTVYSDSHYLRFLHSDFQPSMVRDTQRYETKSVYLTVRIEVTGCPTEVRSTCYSHFNSQLSQLQE